MRLNASLSAATSASAASMATRRPGESGSMRCIVSVNVASGRNARPSRARLTSSMIARPATRTDNSPSRMGAETVNGPKASAPTATASTAASIRKIRQNSDGGRVTGRTATAFVSPRRLARSSGSMDRGWICPARRACRRADCRRDDHDRHRRARGQP